MVYKDSGRMSIISFMYLDSQEHTAPLFLIAQLFQAKFAGIYADLRTSPLPFPNRLGVALL